MAGLGKGILLPAAALVRGGVLIGALMCFIGGCITINIYFPAAAAEKAADRIIDDVLSTGKGGADAPASPVTPAK